MDPCVDNRACLDVSGQIEKMKDTTYTFQDGTPRERIHLYLYRNSRTVCSHIALQYLCTIPLIFFEKINTHTHTHTHTHTYERMYVCLYTHTCIFMYAIMYIFAYIY
jgi:hypothetical protein